MHGTVLRVDNLTPQLVRIEFGGVGLDEFVPVPDADSYVKLQFPPAGASYAVPYDAQAVRELPRELQPAGRRYTVRAWDPELRVLTIEFVTHGDEGIAGRWAQAARPGDLLAMTGPAGGYSPDPTADWHLLIGDESALPAIAVAAERIPEGRPVVALVEVGGPEGELIFSSPGALSITWVHRQGTYDDGQLVRALKGCPLPSGRGAGFLHGEAVATRHLRTHVLTGGVIARADLSVSPYWRYGHTDEQWRSIKAAWQRDVETDVPG